MRRRSLHQSSTKYAELCSKQEVATISSEPDSDADSVRDIWDRAADAYTEGQLSGRDHYRYLFFGPAQAALCGAVDGLHVLDVGCGNGYFAREMAARGARVTGIDISPRMIEQARRLGSPGPAEIDYRVLDARELAAVFPPAAFDLVTSCVALQDMPRPAAVLEAIARVLKPGGRCVVSITHPCTDTPFRAWEREPDGRKRWLCIDRYFERGPLHFLWKRWGRDFETTAWHATLEDWLTWILTARFQLRAVREPVPTEAALLEKPDLEDATRVPYFLLFDLVRPGD